MKEEPEKWEQRSLAKPEYHFAFVVEPGFTMQAFSSAVEVLRGEIEEILTPTESGRGQTICRCASCHVAVWSHYALGREHVAFVRVGTLDHSEALAPDVHIFTESTLPWVVLPEGAARFEQFYDPSEVWSAENAERYRRAVGRPGGENQAPVQRQVNDAGSLGSAPV